MNGPSLTPGTRSGSETSLKVTVAIASYFGGNANAQELYGRSIADAMAGASQVLLDEGFDVELEAVVQDTAAGRGLPRSLAAALDASSCLILDLSEAPASAHYQLGYAEAAGVPHLIVIRREALGGGLAPELLGDALIYEDEAELSMTLVSPLATTVLEALRGQRISPYDRDYVWFTAQTEAIHVVASRSTDELYSADPSHRNHVYLEQFSDKDSVLELMVFLSRNYAARVHKYTSEEFPEKQLLRDNLVVVGGPGIDDVLPGNPICRELSSQLRSRISYAADGESLTLQTSDGFVTKQPVYEGERLLVDFGYFARLPNPFEPSATVIMVHGLHTAGVLGAALAFSDHPHASENFRTLRRAIPSNSNSGLAFEAILAVERVGGTVLIPTLNEDWVFPLESQRR